MSNSLISDGIAHNFCGFFRYIFMVIHVIKPTFLKAIYMMYLFSKIFNYIFTSILPVR